MLVSPCRNQISSWMIDLRCSFLVVTSGKALGQIEAHLVAEHAERAGAGAVGLAHPFGAHAAHEIEILLHALNLVRFPQQSNRLSPGAAAQRTEAPAATSELYTAWHTMATRRLPVRHSSQEKNMPIRNTSRMPTSE